MLLHGIWILWPPAMLQKALPVSQIKGRLHNMFLSHVTLQKKWTHYKAYLRSHLPHRLSFKVHQARVPTVSHAIWSRISVQDLRYHHCTTAYEGAFLYELRRWWVAVFSYRMPENHLEQWKWCRDFAQNSLQLFDLCWWVSFLPNAPTFRYYLSKSKRQWVVWRNHCYW